MSDFLLQVDVPRPDEESARIVQQSVARLGNHLPALGEAFYRHLFAMLPEVRPLFPEEMADQRQRLLQALLTSVNSLHDPAAMEGRLQQLGESHYQWGILEDQYQYVAHALVRALRDINAGDWSTWVSSAWISVYSWMIAHMVAGARRARLRDEARAAAHPLPAAAAVPQPAAGVGDPEAAPAGQREAERPVAVRR